MPAALHADTRTRLLREALRLFALQGFHNTSVADVQRAAGLAPTSGALYKHFPSKESLLREVVENFVADADRVPRTLAALPTDPAEALAALAHEALRPDPDEAEVLRVVWRELDSFPDLLDRVLDARMARTYDAVAGWLGVQADAGALRADDPEALAAVLVGALRHLRVHQALLGRSPLDLPDDRYLDAWLALARGALLPPASGRSVR